MMEYFIHEGAKKLRCGYTTGTCAALAAQGAARALLTGRFQLEERIATPKGFEIRAPLAECRLSDGFAECAVRKDGGDDIDATDGLLIFARVRRLDLDAVIIDGGPGVGRVTRHGLNQPVGAAAINRVPREMIEQAVRGVLAETGASGGLSVEISVPRGEEIAKKTFNGALGIVGGISILGTSGIVEPKSLKALLDSIEVELRVLAADGKTDLILTPGNYGQDFIKTYPALAGVPVTACANFIGDSLDFCAQYGFKRVLLVGHIGKFVKLAGGVMNTHSRTADCRAEIFAAHAAACGADTATARRLLDSVTSDECIGILDACGLREPVLRSILHKAQKNVARRADGAFETGVVLFSNQYGVLALSDEARALIETFGG